MTNICSLCGEELDPSDEEESCYCDKYKSNDTFNCAFCKSLLYKSKNGYMFCTTKGCFNYAADFDNTVEHPSHYGWIKNIECMDVVKYFDFPIGNVIKYCWRAGYKSTSTKLEDLQKAKYYIDIAIEMENAKSNK